MARINKRSMVVTIGGTAYTQELTKALVSSDDADNDFVTFADAAAGGARQYTFEGECAQDAAVGSLWRKIWDSPGTSVAVLLKPYGNATASTTQPHFSFNATVKEPNGDFLGGEADASVTAVQSLEFEWPLDAKPTMVTT